MGDLHIRLILLAEMHMIDYIIQIHDKEYEK